MIIINKTYQKLCKLSQDNFIDVQARQKKVSYDFVKIGLYSVHKPDRLSHCFIQLNLNFKVCTHWNTLLPLGTWNLDATLCWP
jgi:hypothetical protein